VIGSRLSQLPIRPRAATSCVGVLLALASVLPAGLHAQETLSSLQGTVRNESGQPIEQAQVILDPGQGTRELRTDRDGGFRFIGVSPATHRLRVLRIGFQPYDTTVTVEHATTLVVVSLRRLTTLGEVAVVARPTGIYGTVLSRDSLKPVAGARVELLGANTRDATDAAGGFAMGRARPGTFLLRVTREGFDTRTISVRVPRDSGVGIDIVLKPGSTAFDQRMEMLWADLGQRINWAGVNSAFVGREELAGHGSSVDLAIKFAPSFAKKGLVIDEKACVYVDGLPRPFATIRDFNVEDVESIEVYGRRGEWTGTLGKRWPPKVPCGNPEAKAAAGNRANSVVIWTKR
jgi:hypothetical protein